MEVQANNLLLLPRTITIQQQVEVDKAKLAQREQERVEQ